MRRVDYMVGNRDFKTMTAGQFMQDDVYFYHVDDKGDRLAEVMTSGGFGSVPVLNQERRLIGIVSEFDLLRAVLEDKSLSMVTAGELMTPNPITVEPDTPAMDIIRLLEEKHLIRLPVVDADGKLKGVVARRDILEGYLKATKPLHGF